MIDFIKAFQGSESIYRFGWTLLHTLWLGAVVAVLFTAAMLILRRRSANARYLVGCIAMVLMVALPVAAFFMIPAPAEPLLGLADNANGPSAAQLPKAAIAIEPGPMVQLPDPAAADLSVQGDITVDAAKAAALSPSKRPFLTRASRALEPALPWAVLAWAVGVFLLSIWQLASWIAARRLKRLASQPGDKDLIATIARLVREMRVSRPVKVLESMLVRAPTVIGWLRPVVLLPLGLATGLPPDQLQAILAHELAHIRRYDYLVNLLQSLVETLLFYHPAVWFISRRIRAERENCCDDIAVAAGAERFSYAESLLHVARESAGKPRRLVAAIGLGLHATSRPSRLRSRIVRLLDGGTAQTTRLSRSWPITMTFLAAIVVTASVLVNVGAQQVPKSDKPTPATQAAEAREALQARIAELIAQLGNTKQTEREAAQKELVKIGMPAVAALRKAASDKDAERAIRARNILHELTYLTDKQKAQLRNEWRSASQPPRYRAMLEPLRRLTAAEQVRSEDWMTLGKVYEGLGRPREAMEAYRCAVRVLDSGMRSSAEDLLLLIGIMPPPGVRVWSGPAGPMYEYTLDGETRRMIFPDRKTAVEWVRRKQKRLRPRWLEARVALGRLERTAAKDPKQAAKTLWAVVAEEPSLAAPLPDLISNFCRHYKGETFPLSPPGDISQRLAQRMLLTPRFAALEQLALARRELGDLPGAMDALARATIGRHLIGRGGSGVKVLPMWRMLQDWPVDKSLPATPALVILMPKEPSWQVVLDTPRSQYEARYWFYSNTVKFWHYRIATRPGRRLARLDVTAEFENKTGRPKTGIRVLFYAADGSRLKQTGWVSWREKPWVGRTTVRKSIDVPARAVMVQLEAQHRRDGHYRVNRLAVRAVFSQAWKEETPSITPPATQPVEQTAVRVYDIRDLTISIQDFRAKRMEWFEITKPGNRPKQEQKMTGPTKEERAEWLSRQIRSIDPKSWQPESDIGKINRIDGNLVITQTPENHERIKELMNTFRLSRGTQIAIEGQFIRVSADADKRLRAILELNVSTAFIKSRHGKIMSLLLTDEQVEKTRKDIQTEKDMVQLTAPRLTLFNGQLAYVSITTYRASKWPQSFSLKRKDNVYWPTGTLLQVCPTISSDQRHVTMELFAQDVKQGRPLESDKVEYQTTISMPAGLTLVLRAPIGKFRLLDVREKKDADGNDELEFIEERISPSTRSSVFYLLVKPTIIKVDSTRHEGKSKATDNPNPKTPADASAGRKKLIAKHTTPPATQPTLSGRGATIVGRVLDQPGGRGTGGVNVELALGEKVIDKTVTREDGNYEFTNVKRAGMLYVVRVGEHGPGIWTEHALINNIQGVEAILGASDLHLKLPSLSGTVRDADTGRSVGGVVINFSMAEKNRSSVITDKQGRYRLYVLPRLVELACQGTQVRYYPVTEAKNVEVEANQEVKDIDFYVRSAPMFTGKVSHPDGKPAKDVDVHVSVNWSGAGFRGSSGTGRTFGLKTDTEGKFVGYLRRPVPRDWQETITLKAIAWLPDRSLSGVTRAKTTTAETRIGLLEVILGKCGSVRMRVVGPDEKPIEHAAVTASDVQPHLNPHFGGPVEYLGDGRYRMTRLIPGLDYYMTANAEGYRTDFSNRNNFTLQPGQEYDAGTLKLEWWGRKAVPDLVRRLKQGETPLRRCVAAELLGRLGLEAAEAVPALREALVKDPDWSVRCRSAATLAQIGKPAAKAIPDLIQAMQEDPSQSVHFFAARALGQLGDQVALPALREAAEGNSPTLGDEALKAIRKIQTGQNPPATQPGSGR